MKVNSNSFWVKFEEFGYYYRVKDGQLKQAPIAQDGSVDTNNKVVLTKIPNEFIDLNFNQRIYEELGFNF